jgi:zinc D-Ala-D-Ala dipeptidase
MKKSLWAVVLIAGVFGCAPRSARESADSGVSRIGTKTGQILGTFRGESVCIHKFVDDHYEVTTPQGSECVLNRRNAPAGEVNYGSDAFLPWLKEVPPTGMIKLNMRYATNEIFPNGDGTFKINRPLYGKARCFLQPMAIDALMVADRKLREVHPEMRLMLFDCYRPQYVSQRMWDLVRDREWVGASGKSGHNIGGTVDLTIATLTENGPVAIDMGSNFDLFQNISKYFPTTFSHESTAWKNRTLLRSVMTAAGMKPYDSEWWHFGIPDERLPNRDHLDLPL